jgi:hypothetical protein
MGHREGPYQSMRVKLSFFTSEQKRRKSEGRRPHAKTMMNMTTHHVPFRELDDIIKDINKGERQEMFKNF